jgi:arylsulfatase A-like enzyme
LDASPKKAAEARPTLGERAREVVREVFGDEPWVILLLVSPTLSAIVMDVGLRASSLRYFPPKEWLNYFGSSLVCAGFWGSTLWLMARLWDTRASRFGALKLGAIGLYFVVFVLPFSFFAYGGQYVYFRVFNSYFSRDSLHLGLELRGTMGAWMSTWAIKLAPAAVGVFFIGGLAVNAIRRAGKPLAGARPWLPLVSFAAVNFALGMDFVETKGLQAAPPDSCFLHSVAGLIHERILHHEVRGVSIRQPDPLPPMDPPAHRPNVILVITESVRSDSMCSEKSEGCKSRFLDDVVPERVGLLRMTSQASGTFTACMTLWTGLAPDADFRTVHHAAFLWEIARAMGYRTAYFGAQNLRYRDLGTYLKVGGIDEIVGAADLGHTSDPHLGAPDELAAAKLVDFARRDDKPYFAVLHLSNTHWPYRVDESMQPFAPHDADPFKGAVTLYNHYRNSVLMQERTVSQLMRDLKGLPTWSDTAVAFVSDHGEQFREHGGLYHLNSIFEEEVRIPGFFVFGDKAVTPEQIAAMRLFRDRRTYNSDVNATVIDLLGAAPHRAKLPFASLLHGRSLLSPPVGEPIMAASTTSGVWEDDNPVYGVIMGDRKVVGGDVLPWACYDSVADPRERFPLPVAKCSTLLKAAIAHYPKVPQPKQ